MDNKPTTAKHYLSGTVELVRAASLYIATKLGDLRDDFVIVGGLVPSLIVPQDSLPPTKQPHVGTLDVDLGLGIALLNEQRYHELCQRLRGAGFQPDQNNEGRTTSQRWLISSGVRTVTIDFLIPPSKEGDRGGALRNIEEDFSAIITPGLELAFRDRKLVKLNGATIHGELAARDIWVCEAGAFVVLKALAFNGRGENKDAYDLIYLLQNYGGGIEEVWSRLEPLRSHEATQKAMAVLERDFTAVDALGPRRVATFLGEPEDEDICADAAGAVRELLRLWQRSS